MIPKATVVRRVKSIPLILAFPHPGEGNLARRVAKCMERRTQRIKAAVVRRVKSIPLILAFPHPGEATLERCVADFADVME